MTTICSAMLETTCSAGKRATDQLYGEDGNDWLSGWTGNDKLIGAAGDDYLVGGHGVDHLEGNDGHDQLYGDEGNDRLLGGVGNDLLIGGLDDDYLAGELGDDHLNGEDGNDELHGADGNDWLSGWVGTDVLVGGAGDDYLSGGAGDDHLNGEDGIDEIHGDDGNDWISGWNGNDMLVGGHGDDQLVGGLGDDHLNGEDGNDKLQGEEGNDWISGWTGTDQIVGAQGNDYLMGGAGDDHISGDDGNDEIHGEDGADWISGWTGNDIIGGEGGDDFLVGGEGDDSLSGGDGQDKLHGDEGNDWLWGGAGNDELEGASGSDFLLAGEGDDTLDGWLGNDLLDGGYGTDELVGGEGRDALIGGFGQDELNGNTGDDLLVGGTTIYDQYPDAMKALMQAWSSADPYASRIQRIESTLFIARLEAEETFFDDGVVDVLYGGEEQDWYVLTGSLPAYVPPAVEETEDGSRDHDEHHHAPPIVVPELPLREGFDLVDSLDKFVHRQPEEKVSSAIPHTDTPSVLGEHLALFELVRYDQVTHFAVRSGAWSDPNTWANATLPADGARVLIPFGVEVTVDGLFGPRIATIRVDGTLKFETSRNTELRVDTLIVSGYGTFQMGTAAQPIARGVRARVLFTGNDPIDRQWDPFGISRGLIGHGTVSIHGAEVSSYAAINGPATAGLQTLTLKSAPIGWRAGDRVVIAGTTAGSEQNEVRSILSISSNRVVLDQPLSFTHAAPAANLDVHIANLTRNAVFESENPATDRRGHVMFMHNRNVDVAYAGFYNLGRTDKSKVINDSVVTNWTLKPGTGTNQRARYPVHFHRNGLKNDGNSSTIIGSAVVGSPGWGFVNHSSYVNMFQNVAFDVTGAAFATEVGDEIGGFYQNMAIGSSGSGEEINSREVGPQDFGHQGDGFWFQGAGVSVVGNIAAGNRAHAFAFYTRGLYEGGPQAEFPSANLPDPSIAGGAARINVGQVPIANFRENIGYGSAVGLLVRYHLEDATHGQRSLFEASTFWNNTVGVALHYAQNTVLRNLTVVSGENQPPAVGVEQNLLTGNIEYDHLTVMGYRIGIDVPRWGSNVVRGGTFANGNDIFISSAAMRPRNLVLTDFTSEPNIWMWEDLRPISQGYLIYLTVPDQVVLNYGSIAYQQLYFSAQQPHVVLFPTAREDVPPEYIGLTNQQLWDRYRVALGGGLAPRNTFAVPFLAGGTVAPRSS